MSLNLVIENVDRLPDGGPTRFRAQARGLDIGRDAHLDWTLPDPERHVSSKHCEIRYRDGGYWLTDVSTNGTFLNGAPSRLQAPHRLSDGDRLTIGRYIVSVAIDEPAMAGGSPFSASRPAFAAPSAAPSDVWGGHVEAAPPEDRNAFRQRVPAPVSPDFLDYAAPLAPAAPPSRAFDAPPSRDDSWLSARPPPAPAAAPPPPPPTPRRPAPAESEPMAAAAAIAAPIERPAPVAPDDGFLQRLLTAADIPLSAVAGKDPGRLADEIGHALLLTAKNLSDMLASRAETKSLIRSSSRTEIRALENNPLRFQAGPAEALAIMLGPPHRSYLGAEAALKRSFDDLKQHQMLTFGAMQAALDAIFEDLSPDKIDKAVESGGLGSLMASRKAKAWDLFVERWRAKTKRSDGRLNEAFTAEFGMAYDRLQNKGG